MTRAALRFAAAAALAALTAGCGGGGSDGIVESPVEVEGGADDEVGGGPVAPRPSCVDNPADEYAGDCEYRRAWGLAAVNAATAYERIAQRDGAGTAPGAGARVAVIDTGIAAGHWEFDSSRVTETCADPNNCGDAEHGTAVSSIIAARRNQAFPTFLSDTEVRRLSNFDFHGIAWGIDHLKVLSIPLGTGDPNENYEGIDPADVDDNVAWLAARFSAVADVDFVNMSFNVSGLVENYLNETFGGLYAPAISTLAQTSTPTGKTVLVVAASNDHGDKCEAPEPNCVGGRLDASSPALFAGLPVLEDVSEEPHGGRGRDGPPGTHHLVLQPLRDRRQVVHRRAGRLDAGRTLRRGQADQRCAGRLRELAGDLFCRTLCDRRSGGDETLVPQPDGE